ncbi:hypothetical protein EET67_23625 [Pseudaminobacter arsenicus]|uniref:Uncharacterized protein n=1 Tax=Borborobacter arsenicus TaxID=1851146 RepID=A0A432UZM0_9HYPH|nr:hypothetical protein [Pseudaminobacter arsenicus]RUM95379.1 hypothetical protein EET67_23625 [Pseudaminobacter arsenicus]
MILGQFLHTEPVAASHLTGLGCRAAAAVVDSVASYLETAAVTRMGFLYAGPHLQIDHVSAGEQPDAARTRATHAGSPP